MEADVELNFQDIELGWTCIFFARPPRRKKSRLHVLLHSLETWRGQNPTRRIEHIQVIKDRTWVRGLNVFWSTFEHLQQQQAIRHFHLDDEIRDCYGHEYVEALMEDAMGYAREHARANGTVLMISRRKVAIALVWPKNEAYVTQLQPLLAALNTPLAQQIERDFTAWLHTQEPGYFCAVLPGEFTFRGDSPP